MKKKIGVLTLQGDYRSHFEWLSKNNYDPIPLVNEIPNSIEAIIFPGGESTAILRLLEKRIYLKNNLIKNIKKGMPVLATCAGVILLSNNVIGKNLKTFKLLDAVIERNAYGPQLSSGIKNIFLLKENKFIKSPFIRAPKIKKIGDAVEILGVVKEEPVFIKHSNILATTFHPEISNSTEILNHLIAML